MKILTLILALTGLVGCANKLSYAQYDSFATQFAVIDWCFKNGQYSAQDAAQFKSATEYNLNTWGSVDYARINSYYRMTYPVLTSQVCANWRMAMHEAVISAGHHRTKTAQQQALNQKYWADFNKQMQDMNGTLCTRFGDQVFCN